MGVVCLGKSNRSAQRAPFEQWMASPSFALLTASGIEAAELLS
jgi:hypothetical protein